MPATPPHLPPTFAQPARGAPSAWFSADDYPVAAMRRGAQGRVVASLTVDRDGRVTGCTVTTSSHDPDLDRATCTIALQRGRYAPARDVAGRPVASVQTLPVRWAMPKDSTLPVDDRAPARPGRPHARAGWLAHLVEAHHLLGFAAALLAASARSVRRRLGLGRFDPAGDEMFGDRMPARRRIRPRWIRWLIALGPVAALAALLEWWGW